MINFRSRNEALRQADKITRKAASVYPHISESKVEIAVDKLLQNNYDNNNTMYKLCNIKLKKSLEIDNLRNSAESGFAYYTHLIKWLKNNKLGNCYEESILAQMIGKINGIKNIYAARIFFNRNSSGAEMRLSHVISVITDKPFNKDAKYKFKNKEAIIIDPWLGITEFAGEYFNKLRNDFGHIFTLIASNESSIPLSVSKTKSLKEYNKIRKANFKSDFSLKLVEDNIESDSYIIQLKKMFPELIIK